MNIKYDKGLYQAKITELEGYHAQLKNHLTNMEALKSKMFNFWEDEKAQSAGRLLSEEIRNVNGTMSDTAVEISVLKGTVEKMGGLDKKQEQELDNAFRALETVADFIPE